MIGNQCSRESASRLRLWMNCWDNGVCFDEKFLFIFYLLWFKTLYVWWNLHNRVQMFVDWVHNVLSLAYYLIEHKRHVKARTKKDSRDLTSVVDSVCGLYKLLHLDKIAIVLPKSMVRPWIIHVHVSAFVRKESKYLRGWVWRPSPVYSVAERWVPHSVSEHLILSCHVYCKF